jgi:putative transposase
MIEIRLNGAPKGLAIPHRIGRHAHPKARPETPTPPPASPSGIDYLRLVDAAHQQHLATQINYAALVDQPGEDATPTDTP